MPRHRVTSSAPAALLSGLLLLGACGSPESTQGTSTTTSPGGAGGTSTTTEGPAVGTVSEQIRDASDDSPAIGKVAVDAGSTIQDASDDSPAIGKTTVDAGISVQDAGGD